MAGERHLEGVLAAAGGGGGVPALGLLLAMEAGQPVPIPSDLMLLLLGERVSAGALPLWVAVLLLELVTLAGTAALFLVARGPGRAPLTRLGPRLGLTGPRLARATELLERRGLPALATGRTTPGLRTVTVVGAASSGIRVGRALPALVLGSSLFLQAHLLLGYALGPAARELLERPGCPCCSPPAPPGRGRGPAAAQPRPRHPGAGRRRLPGLSGPGPGRPSGWRAAPTQPGPVPSPSVGERSPSPGAGRVVVHRVTETGRCLQDRVGQDAERPAEGSGRALPVR